MTDQRDDQPDDAPLDAFDPRFVRDDVGPTPSRDRRLVESTGPGGDPADPKVRILRAAIPFLAIAGVLAVGAVFFTGLRPDVTTMQLGQLDAVRRAVDDRPRRVCLQDDAPCAWLTWRDDRLLAFNTNGPLPEEYGRFGVSWCPTSGWYGSNSTGSRWDQDGLLVEGPSIRSLDQFTILVDDDGMATLDFTDLTAGRAPFQIDETSPPAGPECETIPFDRDSDLDLGLLRLPPSADAQQR